MKPYPLSLLTIFIIIQFVSCNDDTPVITYNKNESNINENISKPSYRYGFILWDDYPGFNLITYGPNGQGWNAVILGHAFDSPSNTNWAAANSEGYSPKVVNLWRSAIVKSDSNYHMNNIFIAIEAAKTRGAEWVYIDDGLTAEYSHIDGEKYKIYESDMNLICSTAHNLGMKVAVSEDCYTVFSNFNQMEVHWSFYQNIDIIMPYGYDRTLSELSAFYSWIRSKGKSVVPILGYHATKNPRPGHPSSLYYQLGIKGGYSGFIELAHNYSRNIFYYFEPGDNLNIFNELTHYLQISEYIILHY